MESCNISTSQVHGSHTARNEDHLFTIFLKSEMYHICKINSKSMKEGREKEKRNIKLKNLHM